MFTQTVRALASAIDARDPSTKKHSEHVSGIAVEIGQAMNLSESELEQLEWAGLLHDIGKIGIRDAVLLKPEKLDREERMLMNEHPVKGEEILKDVDQLAAERPLIRHHHEWYNGSGYPGPPDRRGDSAARTSAARGGRVRGDDGVETVPPGAVEHGRGARRNWTAMPASSSTPWWSRRSPAPRPRCRRPRATTNRASLSSAWLPCPRSVRSLRRGPSGRCPRTPLRPNPSRSGPSIWRACPREPRARRPSRTDSRRSD